MAGMGSKETRECFKAHGRGGVGWVQNTWIGWDEVMDGLKIIRMD